jgi:Zn-dependent peptidase ImmA (M78 family)
MKIKEFNIFGTKWNIIYESTPKKLEDGTFLYGQAMPREKEIHIYNEGGTREKKLTLLHELIHAILMEGSYFNTNDDEPLVEWIAKCLLSLKEQKII